MIAQGKSSLNRKVILEEVSEEAILQFYTGIERIPCLTHSPLRVDNNPSFGVYYSTDGIAYIDFAKGNKGGLMRMLQELFNYFTLDKVFEQIVKDLPKIKELDKFIVKGYQQSYNKSNKKTKIVTHKEIKVTTRDWNDQDSLFWGQYGISLPWLEFGWVYPISHFFINDARWVADALAYCYMEYKDDKLTYKIYQPYATRMKWLNNHDSSVWDLWSQLPDTGDKLIITSSRKDALCLWANTNIPSCSLQAEGYLPKPHVVEELKNRFKSIFVLYDNDFNKKDNYGRNYGAKFSELYGVTQIEIPEIYQAKDPSDLYSKHGRQTFLKIINKLIV